MVEVVLITYVNKKPGDNPYTNIIWDTLKLVTTWNQLTSGQKGKGLPEYTTSLAFPIHSHSCWLVRRLLCPGNPDIGN